MKDLGITTAFFRVKKTGKKQTALCFVISLTDHVHQCSPNQGKNVNVVYLKG
jgi:hypothetical protein